MEGVENFVVEADRGYEILIGTPEIGSPIIDRNGVLGLTHCRLGLEVLSPTEQIAMFPTGACFEAFTCIVAAAEGNAASHSFLDLDDHVRRIARP